MLVRAKGTGFTLIELVIVMAIIAILAAIAYPSYQESVRKGKRTDATGALLDVAQRLERCYTQYNAYNDGNCTAHTSLTGGGIASPEGEYNITFQGGGATPNAYTLLATATGSQTSDTNCGNFTLTNTGQKGETGSKDANYCW